MNTSIWIAILSASVGTILGMVAHELRQRWDDRRANRRVRSRVLYLQLDVLHGLRRADYSDIPDKVAHLLGRRLGLPTEEVKTLIIREPVFLSSIREAIGQTLDETLIARYEQALNELAPIDPVAAFRMSGKLELDKYRAAVDRYFSSISQHPEIKEVDPVVTSSVSEILTSEIHTTAIRRLEEDIAGVASKLDRTTRAEAQAALARMRVPEDTNDVLQDFDRLFDRVFSAMQVQGSPIPEGSDAA